MDSDIHVLSTILDRQGQFLSLLGFIIITIIVLEGVFYFA